jgi:hypothetical protein
MKANQMLESISEKVLVLLGGASAFMVALAWNTALTTEFNKNKMEYGHWIYAVFTTLLLAVIAVALNLNIGGESGQSEQSEPSP